MNPNLTPVPDVSINLNVRGLSQSATLAINELCARLSDNGRQVYRLGLGQSPFPVPQPVVDELKANAHQKDYLPVKGLPQLREAVANYHMRRQDIQCVADDVLIGPGSKELMFILQLVYYGDLVIPTPSWVSYAPQAQIVGRHIRWLTTARENGWRLTPDELKKICRKDPDRPRIVILNYPSNPTGATYSAEELKALAQVAQQYRVVMLSDEIYGELHHQGKHVSIARFYPEGTIISGGLSKWCGAGGWRLGTFTFPKSLHWLRDAMAVVASETYTATSAPIQYAAVRGFQSSMEMERYLTQARRILKAIGCHLAQRLREAGAIVTEPQGAFYLYPDLGPLRERLQSRGITISEEFTRRLLEETGVAVLPGSDFGHPPECLACRLAYVDFDGARALMAAHQVAPDLPLNSDFLKTYCSRLLTAVELMVEWLKAK